MNDWDEKTADDWAQLDADALADIDMNTWALMALAKRVAEHAGAKTLALLADDGDSLDTVEWRGELYAVPIRFGLPDLEIEVKSPIDAMINLHLDRADPGDDPWADDGAYHVTVGERVTSVAPSASNFRRFSDEIQARVCEGMRVNRIGWLSMDDDGIEAAVRGGRFADLDDPVRELAAAVAFVASVGAAIVNGSAWRAAEVE